MRALVCRRFGPVRELAVEELPPPTPGEREVVVRVAAAGLNYPDALMVQGKYQVKPPLPFVVGMELAGAVTAVGARVEELRVGDAVMATGQTGAFAEECAVPVERVMRRPEAISAEVGGGVAHHLRHDLPRAEGPRAAPARRDRPRARRGGRGRERGGRGREGDGRARHRRCVHRGEARGVPRLGADALVDYATEPLRDRLKALTGGRGVDVVYDPVGGDYAEVALRATGWGGRYLVIGFAAGEIPKVPLNLALLNERSIVGVYWGDWAQRSRAASDANFEQIAAGSRRAS